MTPDSFADALVKATRDKAVTVETVGGFRAYGYDLALHEIGGKPIGVALTVDNGRVTFPWHAVNLIHAHDEETGE